MESASSSTKRGSKTSRRGKSLPRRAQDLSKEELLLCLQKKRECNAKALAIVEGMLEPKVNEDWFLSELQHINQSHLQDVIEERGIINLCGYPLCSSELKNIPSQQYRISTRVNKVYDITERKNFCSNKCFKACKFIKDQMYTSPLWLRDIEPSVKFILMPSTEKGGGVGDEINVQIERVTQEEIIKLSGEENSSSSGYPDKESSLQDALNNLHIVASMRENNPSNILVGSSNPNPKEDIQLQENNEENSTISENVMNQIDHSFKREEQEGICRESDDIESNDLQVSPTISLKRKNCDVLSHNALKEISPNEEFDEDDIPKGKKSAAGINSKHPDFCPNAAVSIPQSKSFPVSYDQETKTNMDENTVRSVFSKAQSVNEENIGTLENSVKKLRIGHGSSFPEIKSDCAVRQTSSSSRNMILQPLSESRECKEPKLSDSVDSKIFHQVKADTANYRQPYTKKNKEKVQKKQQSHSSPSKSPPTVVYVEKSIREWFTMETMCFLFGESALKEMLQNKGECIKEHYKALNTITWDQEKHERFLAICKRLSLLEMEDSNFDSQVMKGEGDSKRKPLPHYEVLKREAEAMDLKVNAFFKGKMEISERKVTFAEDVKTDSSDSEKNSEPQIPLVHLHSQRALRKKIVLDGLNRVLPDFLRTFGMRPSELTSSIRGLVSTFALSATNITFKPQEWSLLGLIVIKLLALRDTELRQCLQQEQSNTYLTLMLMSYKQEPGYLDRLLSWLTDLDILLARSQENPPKM